MTHDLSQSSKLSRRTAVVALSVAALATLACAAPGARSDSARRAAAGDALTGKTPGGGTYRFTVSGTRAGRLCERLAVRYSRADGSIADCQPAHGHGGHGLWQLDCRSHDFSVIGTAYAHIRSVSLVSAGGAVAHARLVRRGRRSALVLVAAGRRLPAQLRAIDERGQVVSHEDFDAAQALCAPQNGVQPLSVSYPF